MNTPSEPSAPDDDSTEGSSSSGLAELRQVEGFTPALAIGVIVGLGFGLVIPVVPAFARSFGVGAFAASAIISVFAGVRLVSNLAAGPLIDRIGMRRAVGYGALIVGASSLASALAPNYLAFLLARGVGGFGSALFLSALVTLTLVTVPSDLRGRAVGAVQSSFLIGSAFGPTVGGALAEPLGLRLPFVIYAAACLLAGVVALTRLPAAKQPADGQDLPGDRGGNPFAGFSALLRTRELVAALLMIAGVRWAMSGVRFTAVPLLVPDVIGAGETLTGIGLTVASVMQLLVVFKAGSLADAYGRRRVGIIAFTVFSVVCAAFVFVDLAWTFVLGMALFGLATGFATPLPAAIVGDVVPADRAGRAVGVLNTAGDLGSVTGPIVVGLLIENVSFPSAFVATAVVLAAAAIATVLMRETLQADRPAGG